MADSLKDDPGIKVDSVPGTRTYGIEFCLTKPPFDDVRVRQALNYAIDWDAIIATIRRQGSETVHGVHTQRLQVPP